MAPTSWQTRALNIGNLFCVLKAKKSRIGTVGSLNPIETLKSLLAKHIQISFEYVFPVAKEDIGYLCRKICFTDRQAYQSLAGRQREILRKRVGQSTANEEDLAR